METTPDKYCKWKVTVDYIEKALTQIHKHESTVITVTPYKFSTDGFNEMHYTVTSYLIVYYNPPVNTIPGGIGGDGDSATIQ